ncbi:hypothetical protein SCOCK_1120003 [Actinacidiphila cocklensis]|uniref:Uncharacterized protein n=1 Tax=Actinacidiphila cocklensis TaxID=887465 RepID=A0A9W4E2B0_9ACTN|nr:hypothetical protein SCOCK_1120003 [Actinacidiphila cocklensis]
MKLLLEVTSPVPAGKNTKNLKPSTVFLLVMWLNHNKSLLSSPHPLKQNKVNMMKISPKNKLTRLLEKNYVIELKKLLLICTPKPEITLPLKELLSLILNLNLV